MTIIKKNKKIAINKKVKGLEFLPTSDRNVKLVTMESSLEVPIKMKNKKRVMQWSGGVAQLVRACRVHRTLSFILWDLYTK